MNCQDKHGVGGDLRICRMSAPGNECLRGQRAEDRRGKTGEEEKEEQDVIYVGADC